MNDQGNKSSFSVTLMTFIVNCFPKSRFGRPHVQPEYHDILPSQPTIQNLLHVQMQIIKKQQQKKSLVFIINVIN